MHSISSQTAVKKQKTACGQPLWGYPDAIRVAERAVLLSDNCTGAAAQITHGVDQLC